jgi:endonuclease/exonuclease/phosphatase family metal-dependent hydrolase
LFCFWNVENLFDDREDGRVQAADKEFDAWFANDPVALKLKLQHLSDALLQLNGGKGPDILALAEVENPRAAELLRQTLNGRLGDPSLHYQNLLMKDLDAGRHIAPAILTRLPVRGNRTQLHGRRQRILEGHVTVNGHDLIIIASHWTSRVTDKDSHNRGDYGDQIYGLYRAMARTNPAVDLLVAGDFNDPPDAASVTGHLHAYETGNGDGLCDLFAGKDPSSFGTHYFRDHWAIFDQIVVAPGLFDTRGWSCDPASTRTINTLTRPGDRKHRPWRFGSRHDRAPRGYSDHFPVTVRLMVEGPN